MLIKTTFKPAWWLNNAHLQTLYPSLCRKNQAIPSLRRERLITPDNDFIDIDCCGEPGQPIAMLLHGLSGSSQSSYINGLQLALLNQGWRSVAVNFRGCSGEYNHLARCYHSGETEDIHFVYQTLKQREPDIAIAAVGFSLGGNVLLKWLGEQGDLALVAAVAVSVPLVLSECASKLDTGFSRIYRQHLLQELKRYIHGKQRYLGALGKVMEAEKLRQLGDLSDIHSFWEYDGQVVAKLHGFASAQDYYRRSSARQFLPMIKVPTLVIQAGDDPFMTKAVIPLLDELSASVSLELSPNGGHVGFVAGWLPFKPAYWLDQRISSFLQQHLAPSG